MRLSIACLGCFLLMSGVVAVVAQEGLSPLGIVPVPAGPLSVSIWTDKAQYTIGETARIYFSLSKPAYVYIFDFEPTGYVRQIFPNAFSNNAYVSAGQHVLPDKRTYQFRVTLPAGREQLQIVASTTPLAFSAGRPSDPFPLMGSNTEEGKARVLGVIPEPSSRTYATAWTAMQIIAHGRDGGAPCPPCRGFGPCPPCRDGTPIEPGAGWFCDSFGKCFVFIGTCPPEPGWCWYLGPDGQWHTKVRMSFGRR